MIADRISFLSRGVERSIFSGASTMKRTRVQLISGATIFLTCLVFLALCSCGGGGASSNTQPPPITNPSPTLQSISPSSAPPGAGAFILTISGTNFLSASVVTWNGTPKATTYISSTQLTAAILAADVNLVGTVQVAVVNPSPGGGTSSNLQFTVQTPLPAISSLSPTGVVIGTPGPLTLTVDGSNFVQGATVYWNGISRVTTYVSSTQLNAAILVSDLAVSSAGTASVTVQNPSPSQGVSNIASFNFMNPAPQIVSITPTGSLAGNRFNVTISGQGFVSGATVQIGTQNFPVNYQSSTMLNVPGGTLPVGVFQLTVLNPAPSAGPSNSVPYTSNQVGPGEQPVAVSVEPNGNLLPFQNSNGIPQDVTGVLSSTGQYVAFDIYLRDTCLGVTSGCTPSTIQFNQTPSPLSDSASGISATGRYATSGRNAGEISRYRNLEVSDSCVGVGGGCTVFTQVLTDGVFPDRTPMSDTGRYIAYITGNTNSTSPYQGFVYDTCAGAPPGCAPTAIGVSTPVAGAGMAAAPTLSGDARYLAYAQETVSTSSGTLQPLIVVHDTCLGAAPGCSPSDVQMTDGSTSCSYAFMSRDAAYVAYSCGNPSQVFLQQTCASSSGTCPPAASPITSPEVESSNNPMVSTGGRYIALQAPAVVIVGEALSYSTVFVFDTCNGATGSCVPRGVEVCLNSSGALANSSCFLNGFSSDGKYILFSTDATNLIPIPSGVASVSYIVQNPLF